MHGRLDQVRNGKGDILDWDGDLSVDTPCPHTQTSLRPHVVWFGEMPLHMERILGFLPTCTHFAAIGTSGQVYPGGGLRSGGVPHGRAYGRDQHRGVGRTLQGGARGAGDSRGDALGR
jgi:NAD-dependent deacetylase